MCTTAAGDCEISPCVVCRGRRFRKLFTKKGRDFWRCRNCGLERLFPLPTLEELREYYDQSYKNATYKDFAAATDMKRLTAKRRLGEILPHCRPGRWLDVGCSNGVFVEHLRQNGLEGEGVDLSEVAVEAARRRGLPVVCSTVEKHDPGYCYDTVTCFDILEHVPDPPAFLSSVHRLLVTAGTLALSLPNLRSVTRALMRRRWYFYNPEEHLYYFTPSTIKQLLCRAGFEVIRCGSASKPLTYNYSLIQLKDHNPMVYAILNLFAKLLPNRVREMTVPLYIGEMMVIAKRRDSPGLLPGS